MIMSYEIFGIEHVMIIRIFILQQLPGQYQLVMLFIARQ